jgi:hypothetical protein
MGIPVGTKLCPCPVHDLTGRVWVLPMDIKCTHTLSMRVRYPQVPILVGKIAILTPDLGGVC